MAFQGQSQSKADTDTEAGIGPMSFGAADLRLAGRHWALVLAVVGLFVLLTPTLWTRVERFDAGPDYRLPYALSRDYWLYSRRSAAIDPRTNVVVLGDSVVWGEYVRADGTWSHGLNREAGSPGRFVNGGVNGLFPMALEGLASRCLTVTPGQKVLLQCNLLWMTSPQVDLSADKEEHFNHPRLVPQFSPRLPAYRADTAERLDSWIQVHTPFLMWVDHLKIAYFDQKSLPAWTLADDGSEPPRYPNLARNPFSRITLTVPPEPDQDPQRGPDSPRHRPWSDGKTAGTTRFEWVPLDRSLQWAAFQRLVLSLKARGADVFVVVGPFNEHLLAEDNRPAHRTLRDGVDAWLTRMAVPHWVPEPLPSGLYADASHPLTAGYELLARRAYANESFRRWADGN